MENELKKKLLDFIEDDNNQKEIDKNIQLIDINCTSEECKLKSKEMLIKKMHERITTEDGRQLLFD